MCVEEIDIEIIKINDYLKKCLWMDFEFVRMDGGNIVVAGRIDTSYNDFAINIYFEDPSYIASLFSWHLDNSKLFIERLTGYEAQNMDDKFQIEHGSHIFKINAEDFGEAPIVIVSKRIQCQIVDERPFSE